MRYVLAIVLPPLAVFTCGKVWQGLLNIVLTIFGWIPGVAHAMFVVSDYHADKRANRVIDAIRAARS